MSQNQEWMGSSKGRWMFQPKGGGEPIPVMPPPTDEQMICAIIEHQHLEDKDFFREIVDWLRRDAPRKLRWTLQELWPGDSGLARASADLSYGRLCEVVYKLGFRTSEAIEGRMMLETPNDWVKKYFEDFPNVQSN